MPRRGVTAATFFKMASNAGINLQDYAREKNREIWNRGEKGSECAVCANDHLYQKSDILDNSLIINNSSKMITDCANCANCANDDLSTTSENFGIVSFQTTFSEKTGQNVLYRFLKCGFRIKTLPFIV